MVSMNEKGFNPITEVRDGPEIYGVVVEFKNEAPILMEAEGKATSRDSAEDRLNELLSNPRVLRGCVVRLQCVWGNELLLSDMERMQK